MGAEAKQRSNQPSCEIYYELRRVCGEVGVELGGLRLSIYRELGDRSGMALVLINLGDVACEREEAERACTLCDEALHLCRELGNERGVNQTLARLATHR